MHDLERLKSAFDYLKSNKYFRNQQDFVERIGSDKTTVSQILNGKKDISKQFVCKVSEAFPVISERWLNGEVSEMLNPFSREVLAENKKTAIVNNENRGVPYYDVDFIGGYDLVENDQTAVPAYFIDFPEYNNADEWINITGRSMDPLISHGDKIAVRELREWDTYLLYGEIYALVTDQYRTVKIIRKSKLGNDYLRLVPINSEFDEQDIPKSIVRHVFNVLGTAKKMF